MQKKSWKISGILILTTVLLTVILIGFSSEIGKPKMVRNGEIEITNALLDQSKWISLSGDWYFKWQTFFSPNQPIGALIPKAELVSIPSVWNSYKNHYPGEGYATYALKVTVEDPDRALAIRIENVSTAYTCYINGVAYASNGNVGENANTSVPYYSPRTIRFTPKSHQVDIVIHISNYTYSRGGLWYNVYIGDEVDIDNLNDVIVYKDAMIIGSLLIMGVYFLNHFILLRKAWYGMYFVIMCILLILRTTLYGDYLLIKLFPDMAFNWIVFLTYFTIVWFPITLFQMIQSFTQEKINSKMSKSLGIYGVLVTIVFLLTPVKFYTAYLVIFECVAFSTVVYALVKVFIAYGRNQFDSLIPLMGATVIIVAGIHDVFYQSNKITNVLGELSSLSLVIFMYMLTYMMNKQFSKAHSVSIQYSERLKVALEEQTLLTTELVRLDKVKDQFLTTTSHELRTPINGIINITDSVINGVGGTLSEIQMHSLTVVKHSAERLNNLINDILDAALIKENRLKLNISVFDMHALVEECVFLLKGANPNGKITVLNAIPANCYFVKSDEERFKQVLFNLIGNAIKYTLEGNIIIRAEMQGQTFDFSVSDTGIGIPDTEIEIIYDLFTQGDSGIERKHEGMGIGLYITKKLVNHLGGSIKVTSQLGVGSTFTVSFDKSILESNGIDVQRLGTKRVMVNHPLTAFETYSPESLPFEPGAAFSKVALVVDDDVTNRMALKNHLSLIGYNTVEAENGKEAITLIESGLRCDFMLLDLMMPNMSGFDVLKIIREKFTPIDLPIIVITARINPIDITKSMDLGANDYIAKPYEVNELFARIKNVITNKETFNQLIQMELAFLQAQIKPHFVFNTLSTISSLSLKEPSLAKNLILDLADYLRLSFDFENKSGLSNLNTEIKLTKAYIEIELARFSNRLKVTANIAEHLDIELPVLCLQPLVENAIKHGALQLEKQGLVNLSIEDYGNYVRICVSDNGPGIDYSVIRKIYSRETSHGHVGLSNINNRLIKFYGRGLSFSSDDVYNTVVSFEIPY